MAHRLRKMSSDKEPCRCEMRTVFADLFVENARLRILQKAQMSFFATKRRREQWPSNSSGLLL